MRIGAAILLLSGAARAGANDLQLWRLGHPDATVGAMTISARRFVAMLVATALSVGTAAFAVSRSVGVTVTPSTASPVTVVLTR